MSQQNLADLIWNVADVLRWDFKQSEFGRPASSCCFTMLRWVECMLEPTHEAVRTQALKARGVNLDLLLPGTAGARPSTTFRRPPLNSRIGSAE
ncbi:hypothetical protein [Geopseudomonas aromaticivorans]